MDEIYQQNLQRSQLEYRRQHIYLRSLPRCLGLVLGNGCNIGCPHCYQAKNGDNLLKPPAIGRELRREFAGFYPHLATLRIQGGEAFAFPGFRELIEDVRASVERPILSVSTNGTLIDEEWAETMCAHRSATSPSRSTAERPKPTRGCGGERTSARFWPMCGAFNIGRESSGANCPIWTPSSS